MMRALAGGVGDWYWTPLAKKWGRQFARNPGANRRANSNLMS